jgi:hypothetical protein
MLINNSLYGAFVIAKDIDEYRHITDEFSSMRATGKTYVVRAQHFYSNYILLSEQNIPYKMAETLNCDEAIDLFASSTTTQYCN